MVNIFAGDVDMPRTVLCAVNFGAQRLKAFEKLSAGAAWQVRKFGGIRLQLHLTAAGFFGCHSVIDWKKFPFPNEII